MARYTGADCRKCRRAKMKLYLKGSKCDSAKCPFEARPYPPGQHGRGRSKDSEYLLQLREKQKAKQMYGIFERQFRGYVQEASRKPGNTGTVILRLLEQRLDNVIRRLGWARTIWQARQMVAHGHINVNGKKVDRPSYQMSVGDEITLKKDSGIKLVRDNMESLAGHEVPGWLEYNPSTLAARIVATPTPDQVPFDVNMNLIVEFYR